MKRMLLSLVAAVAFVPTLAQAQAVAPPPGIHVTVAPPAPRVEVRPMAPSSAHVWVGGHWEWRRGGHVWIPGRWMLPPGPGYRWVPARWVHEPNGQWTFYAGRWVMPSPTSAPIEVYDPGPAPAQPVVVQVAPPAPRVEVRPAMPFAGAVWIPGYWQWNGVRHVWVAGRWSAPRAGWHWQPNHWRHTPRGWIWVPGHWRRG